MTRSPTGQEPPVRGGGAAERLRQFLRARFGDTPPDTGADGDEDADEAPPEDEEPNEAGS
ncbi:MAG TPA: hypothetical protein VG034_14080 [Acidimicrobiia bacterium]|nr:hypothetical protein [Acidimicrobiia bacterium]